MTALLRPWLVRPSQRLGGGEGSETLMRQRKRNHSELIDGCLLIHNLKDVHGVCVDRNHQRRMNCEPVVSVWESVRDRADQDFATLVS